MPEPYGIETAGSFGTGNTYIIVTVADTDFTAIGAIANRPGVVFEATGEGQGSGTARRLNVQMGRIGGKMLAPNLIRNGFDLEFDNNLLYLNVNDKKVSVNTDISSFDLYTSGTSQTSDLLIDESIVADGLTFTKDRNLTPATGDIVITPTGKTFISTGLSNNDILITNNQIRSLNSNSNIDIKPAPGGILQIENKLNVNGNLEATGDITIDGSITFGDSDTDNVTFASDINSDIVPNLPSTYRLGTPTARWENVYTNNVNGSSLQLGFLGAGGVDISLRQGNLWYVSVNGSDENFGDHQLDPFKTIEKALEVAESGDTVLIYPGEYEENVPLVVPQGVTVKGTNIRNVVIVPPSSMSSNDIFHLNGESYVESITIKNFYYDSINNTGYAFRFAPGATITSRSPYIQNITVITNPSGISSNDAGRGAYIDGAEVDSNSNEASMLFHSCTFIVPGADAITMTNGVRVEWLNSFTYFANRSLYATRGVGRITQDGSTRRYGAEIRSIGSASIYGTYGAVADGLDTLMYLINHNFAYIGVGTDTTNDNTFRIEANEVVMLNDGKIYFQSQDHRGKFKVGSNFFVDFDRGTTSINVTEADIAGSSRILVDTQGQIIVLDSAFIDTGSIAISGNIISNASGILNLLSATGQTTVDSTLNISKNFSISGDLSIDGEMFVFGDQFSDSIKFEAEIAHSLIPAETTLYELGSDSKRWLRFPTTAVVIDDILINGNFIETSASNADLELRAAGTGKIYTPDSVLISNDLSVGSDSSQLRDVNITGSLDHTGDITQTGDIVKTGNVEITGDLSVSNDVQLEDIKIFGNVITTTESNSNLRLVSLESLERRRVFGVIRVPSNDIVVERNFNLGGITTTDDLLYPDAGFVTQEFGTDELRFFQNNLSSINSNVDIDLRATGDVLIGYNDVELVENLTVQGSSDLQGLNITGTITHQGNKTQTGNMSQLGDYYIGSDLITDSDISFENISITNNKITTTLSSSNLELIASGTGKVIVPQSDVLIENDLTNDLLISSVDISNTNSIQSERFKNQQLLIEGNLISATTTDSDIELRSTARTFIPNNNVEIAEDLTVLTDTSIKNINVTGSIVHTGDRNQTGNYSQIGDFLITGSSQFDRKINFENIQIEGNVITTLVSNSDLELRADGFGIVNLQENVRVIGDLTADSLDNTGGDISVDNTVTTDYAEVSQVDIYDNIITTNVLNTDLQLLAGSNGIIYSDIVFPSSDVQIDNDLTVVGITDTNDLEILGDVTHIGNRFNYGNYFHTGILNITGAITTDRIIRAENIQIDDNVITTTRSNSDLELAANSLGQVIVPTNDVQLDQNFEVQGTINLSDLNITGTITQIGNVSQTGNFAINGEISNGTILIEDDFITTVESNASLTLRASGTGRITADINDVVVQNDLYDNRVIYSDTISATTSTVTSYRFATDNLEIYDNVINATNGDLLLASTKNISWTSSAVIENDLTVNGHTYLKDLGINGSLTQTGNRFQIGDYQHLGVINIDGNIIGDRTVAFESILINDNFITTTDTNDPLTLKASGTGKISVPANDVLIPNDLSVIGNIEADLLVSQSNIDSGILTTGDITFNGNQISTAFNDSDLEISSTREILIPESNVVINNDLTVAGITDIDSVGIVGTVTHTGDRTQLGDHTQTGNTVITGTFTSNSNVLFEDVKFENNIVTTTVSNSDLELRAAGTGQVLVPNKNVVITNDLTVEQTLFSSTINTPVTVTSGSFTTGDINITTNEISTTVEDSDLILQSTRNIVVQTTDLEIDNDLTVENTSNVRNLEITGDITHTGNKTFTGTYVQTGDTEISNNLTVTQDVNFEDIRFLTNTVTTSDSNSNLELAASSTGSVVFDVDALIQNNLRINGVTNINDLIVSQVLTADRFETQDQEIYDNRIQTTNNDLPLKISAISGSVNAENVRILNNKIFTNAGKDLIFSTAAYIDVKGTNAVKLPSGSTAQKTRNTAGDFRFNSTESVFEGYYQSRIGFGGIYSDNKQTNLTAHPFDNVLRFRINGSQVGYIVDDLFNIHGIQIDEKLSFQGSTITTLETNGSINLVGNSVVLENSMSFNNQDITNILNTPLILRNTGTGYVSFAQGLGLVIPVGDTAAQTFAEVGDLRYNTDINDVEVFNGTEYQALSGDPENAEVDAQIMGEITNEWSLILG